MRDEDRIDLMTELLRQVWHKHPDMRLGQLVRNAPYFTVDGELKPDYNSHVFLVEDDVMWDGLRGLLNRQEETHE